MKQYLFFACFFKIVEEGVGDNYFNFSGQNFDVFQSHRNDRKMIFRTIKNKIISNKISSLDEKNPFGSFPQDNFFGYVFQKNMQFLTFILIYFCVSLIIE